MKVNLSAINRFFNVLFGSLAMLLVALVSAFLTMRLAIHGHEVKVPTLTGLTLADAGRQTSALGLTLTLENRFYSPDTPSGRVLAQSPAPGATVRREWPVRITESLGPQEVAIPDVLGQSERTASINIRRLSLELGVAAHILATGEPGLVLAQTPTPNATGVDRPRVSLLVSAMPDAAQDPESPDAVVMPSLAGLSLAGASARAAASGLHIASAEDLKTPAPAPSPAPGIPPTATPPAVAVPSPQPLSSGGTVVGQTPSAGHRVLKGQAVHITLGK
ncbi:MAG: PASTA domain-containing protein [Acidobacteriota bacterium]|nr:PASTA domain-containing protein [Acidobacteriota bacterium]